MKIVTCYILNTLSSVSINEKKVLFNHNTNAILFNSVIAHKLFDAVDAWYNIDQ